MKTFGTAAVVAFLLITMGAMTNDYFPLKSAVAQPAPGDSISSNSTTAGGRLELRLTIGSFPEDTADGSSVELYLEDHFQVPDSITPGAVYFTVNSRSARLNDGRRVYASEPIAIDKGNHYGGDDDWSIRVFIPAINDPEDSDYSGPVAGEEVTLVFTRAAGIKNPSEAGSYRVGYAVLGPDDNANDGPQVNFVPVQIHAKIFLSDKDNIRGHQLTVTGAGFNEGTTAAVYVLHDAEADFETTFDELYAENEANLCERIIREGVLVGTGTVGSDGKVVISFEVTVPIFGPGPTNYICMIDGEGRASITDVEIFTLESFIRAEPSTVAPGETVTVFAMDFPNQGAFLTQLKLAGQTIWDNGAAIDVVNLRAGRIGSDGLATVTFTVPSKVNGIALLGIIRVDAKWGDISEDTRITVTADGASGIGGSPLATPTGLTATPSAQPGTINLFWDAPVGAQYHFVAWIPQGVTDLNRASIMPASAQGRATIAGLDVGTTYIFVVIAGRWEWTPDYGAKWSDWSNWTTATPSS